MSVDPNYRSESVGNRYREASGIPTSACPDDKVPSQIPGDISLEEPDSDYSLIKLIDTGDKQTLYDRETAEHYVEHCGLNELKERLRDECNHIVIRSWAEKVIADLEGKEPEERSLLTRGDGPKTART
jgi:hypothetical protein